MRKSLLHALFATLTVALAVVLCACGGGAKPEDGVTFKNSTDFPLICVYISSTSEDAWGEHLNDSDIAPGKTAVVSGDALVDGGGVPYDIGALDDDDIVYEFYGVTVDTGYTLDISVVDGSPVLTVTDTSGGTQTYEGFLYPFE